MRCHFSLYLLHTLTSYLITGRNEVGQGNVFTSVCLSTGGVSASVHAGIPPRTRHPPGSRHPPRPGNPTSPPDQAPPRPGTPPDQETPPSPPDQAPPPPEADCSIRLTSGRYASYWNAFLLTIYMAGVHSLSLSFVIVK